MIKLFCDRCMSEIYGNGYNIKICEGKGINALYNCFSSGVSTVTFDDLLGKTEIYCKDCIEEIKHYINIKK